jgi:hypothetical protein
MISASHADSSECLPRTSGVVTATVVLAGSVVEMVDVIMNEVDGGSVLPVNSVKQLFR